MSEWKMVPVEPTDNMKSAAALLFTAERIEFQKTAERGATFCGPSPEAYYRAMLSAAPQPEQKPVAWMLKTGHGTKIVEVKPPCEVDLWKPLIFAPTDSGSEHG